ncbi:MAG TPA: class I SAM-dependent methyltransferase [Thermoanaerobaculia bacterium]
MFGPLHAHRLGRMLREVANLAEGSRILDGAVGLGTLAVSMQQRGHRPIGIDYSFDAALHVKKTSTIPVVVGDMTRMPFRDGAFDGVTSGETLEHLERDAEAAGEIHRVLRDGGLCVITVPALMSLWSTSDDYYGHLRRYTRETLGAMFRAAGFQVAKARYWGFPAALAYDIAFLRRMNRRRATRPVTDDKMLRSVARVGKLRGLVALVRAAFNVDYLFSWLPYGPGLLLVGRK